MTSPVQEETPYRTARLGTRKLRMGGWGFETDARALPLLIFNGIGINMEVMEPLVQSLAAERPVVMFDMPGIGGSPAPLVPYAAWQAARWAAELLDNEAIAQADILGISWGGVIAQQFALQHRKSVRRLALATIGPGLPFLDARLNILARVLDLQQFAGMMRGTSLAGLADADLKVLGRRFQERLRTPSTRGYIYQLGAISGWFSTPALPLLDLPTLVMAGSEDQIVPPANSRLLADLIPDSRLEVIEGAGHLLMFSHQAQFLALLREFLDAEDSALKKVA